MLHGAALDSTLVKLRLIDMPSKHRITVNLSPEEHHALVSLSEKSRISQAWIARQALVEFLERHQDDQLKLPFELAKPVQSDIGQASTKAGPGPSIRARRR